jgi:hypothetical protein
MQFAFYKAKEDLFDRLVSWKMQAPYTHVEAIIEAGSVTPYMVSASSSLRDGGVRMKRIDFTTGKWDIIDVPSIDKDKVVDWFYMHRGEKYNIRGLIDFVVPFPIKSKENTWFCDQAIAAAIGLKDCNRFDVNGFASVLEFVGGTWITRS